MTNRCTLVLPAFLFFLLATNTVNAQLTEFTYQGNLVNSGTPANGNHDFEFLLFDALSGGTQLGTTQTRNGVAVANGSFSVSLDFGNQFPGADRWIEIRVRPTGGGAFTPLAPRQKIASQPYAVRSLSASAADTAANATNAVNATTAATATNALSLGGTAANQYVLTGDARLSDARNPLPGSASYIQNQNGPPQAASNFSISGNGTAGGTLSGNVVNAATQFNLGGSRILSNIGTRNLFAGFEAGVVNVAGTGNAFFGYQAGRANTSGGSNAFFGSWSGYSNTSGVGNTFFGFSAGNSNTTAGSNSFFGSDAGWSNTTGNENTFLGSFAGNENTTGSRNVFVGVTAGRDNTLGNDNAFVGGSTGQLNVSGNNNSFFGSVAGLGTTTGSNNSFFGRGAGNVNLSGTFNTAVGDGANFGAGNLTFATAVGAGAIAGASNTVVLGRPADTVQIPGILSVTGTFNGSGITNLNASNITTGILGPANGGTGVGAVGAAGNFLRSNGTIWASAPIAPTDIPAGNAFYIQNGTTLQGASNFNISGSGTVGGTLSGNIVNATTQFNLAGSRILSNTGTRNLFAGLSAGTANTTGADNSFFGPSAGFANTVGTDNSFFGSSAGGANTSGVFNAFFGAGAGSLNTTGFNNSVFGAQAGAAILGANGNSFFGRSAGVATSSGSQNSFFGLNAGNGNTTGFENTFVGGVAGSSNQTGVRNTVLGFGANLGSANLTNASAIGYRAQVSQSDSLVLGGINGVNGATADTKVGIGTATPSERLHVVGNGLFTGSLTVNGTLNATLPAGSSSYIQNASAQQPSSNFNISGNGTVGGALSGNIVNATTQFNLGGSRLLSRPGVANLFAGSISGVANTTGYGNTFLGFSTGSANLDGWGNSFVGDSAGAANTSGYSNSFFGRAAGYRNTDGAVNSFFGNYAGSETTAGTSNSFFGYYAGDTNTTGSSNTLIGSNSDVLNGNLSNATAIGQRAAVSQSHSVVLGSIYGVNGAAHDTNVGIGTTSPEQRLHVNGTEILSTGFQSGFKFRERGSLTWESDWVLFSENGLGRIWRQGTGDIITFTSGGLIGINFLGAAGATALCRNASNQISTCSSSARYKTNIRSFTPGLDIVRRLRPVAFTWADGGMMDFGLVAEEVAAVEPLLTTTNEKGEVEGVKYDRVGVVLVNAVSEQQARIDSQDERIRRQEAIIQQQQERIQALERALCRITKDRAACKTEKR